MSDLLKEAIADAKAVRETALQNAKMALEEAFTPHLKNMLSAKLSEDDEEEDSEEMARDMDMDDEENDDNPVDINIDADGQEDEGYDMSRDDEEEMEAEGVIEVNGVKYAPVQEAEHGDEDKDEENEELDLESVIKELELEISDADGDLTEAEHEDEEDEKNESVEVVTEEDDEDEKEKQDEQSTSSGIGKGTGVKMASASDEEDPQGAKYHESVEKLGKELKEYKEAVMFLKDKLHEVNILNAKLLFTNRLFKEFVLSNDQKMKIVENFDRAQTTREIKLVYSTLAESFNDRGEVSKKRSVKESASRKTNTTKPQTKIISEEDNVANRFKKLAGILKD